MDRISAPEQNRLLGRLADLLRTAESPVAAPEFLPPQLDVMNLVRQLMLPSAETVEKMSYGDPLFRMPQQSRIPITADREYLADVAGMLPLGAPAARPSARAMQDIVREIQTTPPVGAISPEIAARVIPETKVAMDNKPVVAYHATGKDVRELDPDMASGKSAGTGIFFSSNPYTASTYAAGEFPNVIPSYLDFKRPMVVDAKGANWNRINKKASVELPDSRKKTLGAVFGDELRYVDDYASTDDLARYARQQGYDGLIINNVVDHGPAGRFATDEALEPSTIYVAFDKQQIRSAISDPQMAGLLDQPAQSVVENPLYKLTKEEFLGKPQIVTPKGSKNLEPRVLTTNENVEPEPFMGGKYSVKMSEDGAAVFDGDKVVASYNFGDTLVVDPKYRKRGIAEELVYQWRSRYPDVAKAKTRTKVSQNVQEKVWERIQNEKFRAENEF